MTMKMVIGHVPVIFLCKIVQNRIFKNKQLQNANKKPKDFAIKLGPFSRKWLMYVFDRSSNWNLFECVF